MKAFFSIMKAFWSNNRVNFAWFLLFALAIVWILMWIPGLWAIEVSVAASIAVLLYHTSLLVEQTHYAPKVAIYANSSPVADILKDELESRRAKKVTLILASGSFLQDIVFAHSHDGIQFEIFLQHPDHAFTKTTRDYLVNISRMAKANMDISNILLYKDLAVYEGILIDDRILAFSFYSYTTAGRHEIWGRNNTKVVVRGPSIEYNNAKITFDRTKELLAENAVPFS